MKEIRTVITFGGEQWQQVSSLGRDMRKLFGMMVIFYILISIWLYRSKLIKG